MIVPQSQYNTLIHLGRIHGTILSRLKSFVTPGITTLDVENYFIRILREYPGLKSACKGYQPRGHKTPYPANLCVAINEEAVHVPPHERVINPGDLVTIDLLLTDGRFITDAAISFIVEPEEAPPERRRLLQCAYESLYKGISHAKAGNTVGDISYAIYSVVQQYGFDVLRDYGGHGIGTRIWEDPFIPNYGAPRTGPTLKEGQLLAIEPLITSGKPEVKQINEWATITADTSDFIQVEHTVLVTSQGPIILTKP